VRAYFAVLLFLLLHDDEKASLESQHKAICLKKDTDLSLFRLIERVFLSVLQ
jgi:hypothetical protein